MSRRVDAREPLSGEMTRLARLAVPVALSFNTAEARTLGPGIDWSKPGELLVTGKAKAPSAGKLDIYRMKAPAVTGKSGCF